MVIACGAAIVSGLAQNGPGIVATHEDSQDSQCDLLRKIDPGFCDLAKFRRTSLIEIKRERRIDLVGNIA